MRENAAVGLIPDSLADLTVPIDSVEFYERNPRRGDVELLKRSLLANGLYRPLVVNSRTNEVLAGNHTLKAARELGWTEIAATFVDVDDETAARIVLVDNRSSDLATYDEPELAELLSSLTELDGSGYSSDDLDVLLASLESPELESDEESEEEDARPRAGRYSFGIFEREAIIDEALRHYRETGFPYRSIPKFLAMVELNTLAALDDSRLLRTHVGYSVTDTYHPHRWRARVGKQRNALDTFFDDERFRATFRQLFEFGMGLQGMTVAHVMGLHGGAQHVANFRPGFALLLLRRYAPEGARVLDTSAGYGGRLVAFLASHASEYVGIDPATETQEANARLVSDLCPDGKRVELLTLPAEDVDVSIVAGRFDVALTSPPYFSKERYTDEETQSWKRYGDAESWRDGFLRPTIALQSAALRSGGVNVLNVADVKISGSLIPLVEWTLAAAEENELELLAIEQFPLTRRWGSFVGEPVDEVATEPVLVFRKR
jgi:ParB-like nuclease domain